MLSRKQDIWPQWPLQAAGHTDASLPSSLILAETYLHDLELA